ncbi:hypothetical protein BDW22DRAFT_1429119 [Trametopsis cervina]|nr:hypothetical protein BDW22DRAFT_1429119 [Trametopsis cervina]
MSILTFPGVTTHPVVGDALLELAHGDLTLIAPESPITGNEAKFYSDAVFGTAAQDESVYILTPSLEKACDATSILYATAVSSAGPFFSNRVTGEPPCAEITEAATMGDGHNFIGSDPKVLKAAVTQTIGDATESIGSDSGAFGQVAKVDTGAALVNGGVKGAVGLVPEEGEGVSFAYNGEEMATFTISGRGHEESTEWKQVPV